MTGPVALLMRKMAEAQAQIASGNNGAPQMPAAAPVEVSPMVEGINRAISSEMGAIIQYMSQSEQLDLWGYSKLATVVKAQAIQEMKHTEALMHRCRFLGGVPVVTPDPVTTGEDVPSFLQNNLQIEENAKILYNELIVMAIQAKDNTTRELFEDNLGDEEDHIEFDKAQLTQIEQFGLENYLQAQL